MSVSDLVKLNNIENPDFIRAGDTLILTDAPKKQSPIRRAAIRQTKEKPVEEEKSSFTLIPTNAKAFTRFLLGNFLGLSTEGRDIDVSTLGEEQQTVLKNAMMNARKDGRDYVTYKDYPKMADGQVVDDFYRQKRSETNIFDLAKASFTDPVFEMFTSLGAFNFREMPSGEFEVLPDRYDFDKSKSTARGRANPKDDYSKLTYLGQDISEDEDAYGFNFKGRINVAEGGTIPKDMYRQDGSMKSAQGFLGPVKNLETGKTMTELSIDIPIDGKEVQIPTMVPTLTAEEIKTMQ